jgi:hypothetical protein
MMDLLKNNFYWIDFSIGTAIPLVVLGLRLRGRISRFVWRLFWLGTALGLTWELPLSLLNAYSATHPAARFIQPLPTHFSVLIVLHSFWDGGLFLVGVWLAAKSYPGRWFERFRLGELLVLLLWGQASELAVELLSTFNHGWAYIPYWWNPSLFRFSGSDITLLPQLIWLAAPVVFYLIALRLKPKSN